MLNFSFWFNNPGIASRMELAVLLLLFGAVFLLGVGIILYNKWLVKKYPPKNKILWPAGNGLLYLGLAGFLFTAFRYLGASFLSVRFFPLLIMIISAGWFLYFVRAYIKNVPGDSLKYEADLVKKKYLDK